MAKISDRQLVQICLRELENCSGYSGGELSNERAESMDYYLSEPLGNEVEGQSEIVTSDVRDTVQWIMPSLMRIFATQNAVAFSPMGPDDEDAAEQETDVIRHLFFQKNSGFMVLHNWFFDALLQKNGYVITFWDDEEKTREEAYSGLTDDQVAYLANQDGLEFLEYNKDEYGLWSVNVKITESKGCATSEGSPPEEILVARDSRHISLKKSRFCARRRKMLASDLVASGYDRETVESLPFEEPLDTEESLARQHLSDDELDMEDSLHKPSRTIWVTECYPLIDMDDDGITERWKITMAGDILSGSQASGNVKLLDKERVDDVPLATLSPIPLAHKHYGLSLADIMMDLQEIRTTLVRQILDATYQANSGRVAYNEQVVNHEDVNDNRIGGSIPVDGPVDGNLAPLQAPGPPQQAFALLEYLDQVRKDRTGVGGEMSSLDETTLAQINTGVATQLLDEARGKVELIARIFAETGLRELYCDIHKLMRTYQDIPLTIKLGRQWQTVRPTEWRERVDLDIKVGLGTVARDQRVMLLQGVLQQQKELGPYGFSRPAQIYHTLSELVETTDIGSPEAFYQNPEDPNAWRPPQGQPDAQMMAVQVQARALEMQGHVEQGKLQLAAQKQLVDSQAKQAELALKGRESEIDARLEAMKREIEAAKVASQGLTEAEKVRVQSQADQADLMAKIYKTEADQQIAVLRAAVEKYRTDMQAWSGVEQPSIEQVASMEGGPHDIREDLKEVVAAHELLTNKLQEQETIAANRLQEQEILRARMDEMASQLPQAVHTALTSISDKLEMMEQARAAESQKRVRKRVIRDESDRVIQVGDQRVVRGPTGLIEALE